MSIVLKVEPGVLKQMAGEIEKEIAEIETQFQSLETEIRNSKSYWEGNASDLHQKKYDGMKDDIQEVVARLKSNPTNLLKMAGLYEETESTLTEVAQSLVEDVII